MFTEEQKAAITDISPDARFNENSASYNVEAIEPADITTMADAQDEHRLKFSLKRSGTGIKVTVTPC